MDNKIIETFDLTKIFKLKSSKNEITALNKANISIKEGEIFGLLGPNGAGKTTMISILATLMQPTSGYALIDGYNIVKRPNKVKIRIALMFEAEMLYYRVTGYDNLRFFCKIYDISDYKEKIHAKAKEFGLDQWLNQYVENYSSGMKMKLALLRTILLERKILFLDEPTLGLDVKTISEMVNIIKNLKKTIFLTSHNMNVVEKLCDRVAFIDKGRIIKTGTKDDVKKLEHNIVQVNIEIKKEKNQLKSELKHQEFIRDIVENHNGLLVSLKSRTHYKDLASILSNYEFIKINEKELSLEQLFLKLM